VELYLVRHGDAGQPDPRRWPGDRARPLTPAGSERLQQVARLLGATMEPVHVVLCSPLLRARQTAEVFQRLAGWPAPLECVALVPDGWPGDVLEALASHPGAAEAALIGHQPKLSALIALLISGPGGPARVDMVPGAVARLDAPGSPRPGAATLRWLLDPRLACPTGQPAP
jgi:phosphohistidine phosphatase